MWQAEISWEDQCNWHSKGNWRSKFRFKMRDLRHTDVRQSWRYSGRKPRCTWAYASSPCTPCSHLYAGHWESNTRVYRVRKGKIWCDCHLQVTCRSRKPCTWKTRCGNSFSRGWHIRRCDGYCGCLYADWGSCTREDYRIAHSCRKQSCSLCTWYSACSGTCNSISFAKYSDVWRHRWGRALYSDRSGTAKIFRQWIW